MHCLALATDYDGTLATQGRVHRQTIEALMRFRLSGRHLILVTGRQIPDLQATFPEYDLFDRIVAENGAILYDPARRQEKLLCAPADTRLVDALRALHLTPIHVGRAIVATLQPHQMAVLKAIHALGLELEIIFNKEAVMVLPTGVNKGTGLRAALGELGLPPQNVVGVGDAENDHSLLAECGFKVAVANALPSLSENADLVTRGCEGDGIEELVLELLGEDNAPAA